MLKFFSRLERTRNFVLFIFAILLAASLVFFYAPSRNVNQSNLTNSSETAAKVGGEKVTVGEVATMQQTLGRGGRTLPASFLIDAMVRERMVRGEAARLGLTASDAEVADYIRQQFKPADGKPFSQANYEQVAVEQAGSVSLRAAAARRDQRTKTSGIYHVGRFGFRTGIARLFQKTQYEIRSELRSCFRRTVIRRY